MCDDEVLRNGGSDDETGEVLREIRSLVRQRFEPIARIDRTAPDYAHQHSACLMEAMNASRAILETHCIRKAAHVWNHDDDRHLATLLLEMEGLAPGTEAMRTANREFYDYIVSRADNAILQRIHASIMLAVDEDSPSRRRSIAEALRQRDPERACAVVACESIDALYCWSLPH